ncbi:unannotated protein [freshwater metagenome]|uniref:glutaminase n=1 Tax=freshwater metagenome TaxID=449393 RepID=A0A6J7XU31_9ZZZZ|nr:pyridoxal 5'-phosphate synthase glutaminase subunit PdxT [Actinomycetota bacterium]
MLVGVLALQGDVREHIVSLEKCGADAITVRTPQELKEVEALVIPGGESTTIASLAHTFDLFEPISLRIKSGMPTYGSCAGMILLADQILDAKAGQKSFGGINMIVRRNAFGRQIDSFETDLIAPALSANPIRAVFIRAPWVEETGKDVEILARYQRGEADSYPVAVRQGRLLATAFHPEITGDLSVHRYFIDEVCK